MLQATFDISTNILTILGDRVNPFVEYVTEMGEWNTLYSNFTNLPLFDIQLDFDDSIDTKSENTTLNPENYNLQYVNLVMNPDGSYHMGSDWRNIELVILHSQPFLKKLGIK